MTPYLAAWQHYHARGEPAIPWRDVVDFHFQAGVIINDARLFVMARPVPPDLTAEEEVSLSDFGLTGHHGGTWHVWSAAGQLDRIASLCRTYRIERLHFQRHGLERIHDLDAERFMIRAHEQAERRHAFLKS